MRHQYYISNRPRINSKPAYQERKSLQRESSEDTITLNYSKGNPSDAQDVHPPVKRQCRHDGTSIVSASGKVDDRVSIIAPGINYTSSSGATHSFSVTGESVPAGYYEVSVTHFNIPNHPAGNVSVLQGTLGPCPPTAIEPDQNQEVECPCGTCPAGSSESGGTPPGSSRSAGVNITPFATSSGGSGVVRSANAQHMRFAMNFGAFRGMGQLPNGQLELVAFEYSESLGRPAALSYRHPLAAALEPQGEHIAANEIFRVYNGATYSNYMCQGDGSKAFGIGATTKQTAQARFTRGLTNEAASECHLEDATYVRIAQEEGSALFFDLTNNALAGYITPDGATIQPGEKLAIVRDETGAIRQIWNYWDGLADIVPTEEGYTIALYLPCQVTPPDQESGLFTTEGAPFKTWTVSADNETQSLTIRERDQGLPDSMPDYVSSWRRSTGGWDYTVGEGEEAISETRQKTTAEGAGDYRIVTTLSRNGVIASCVSEEYASTLQGEQRLSRIDGYGSPEARTTTYEYDEAGRLSRIVNPDGGEETTLYDEYGRVSVTSVPWAGGRHRLRSIVYRSGSAYNTEPAQIIESLVDANGTVHVMRTDTYTYSESNHVKRIDISSSAGGASTTQQTATETWQATAANIYARGRIKMQQATNGVQTHYTYTAATEHNALYSVTAETRVANELVAGQSRRRIDYITAEGNTVRREEYILLEQGTWEQLSGTTYTYDEQNRQIGQEKDNGRRTRRILTCTGAPLSETDEDGITTTYGYNTARQHIETIRAEVRDGDTLITPETITTYTRDAAGRELSVRIDTGAMSVTESTVYDRLGRPIRQTDTLGRETITTYSEDGLTTTVTTPAGATLITTRHPDGSIVRLSGSGQREKNYRYDVSNKRLRETVTLADPSAILTQTLWDGFGQQLVQAQSSTTGFIYTRREYNAQGQLTRQYQDTGSRSTPTAPTLYEYDTFGNPTKQTLALAATPTTANSPITEWTYSAEKQQDGVYQVTTRTRYNAQGAPLTYTHKQLISELNTQLESKTQVTDERNLTSVKWTEYTDSVKLRHKSSIPTSATTAETEVADGYTLMQRDHTGVTTTHTRCYRAEGTVTTQTDSRGNTTTTASDTAGRPLSITDAAGHTTTMAYGSTHDHPTCVTDALGNSAHYQYDHRGRKTAQWGSSLQPARYSYDEADRLVSLTTYRREPEATDPSAWTGGDTTTWTYHNATGLETRKTDAVGNSSSKTYDAYNRVTVETNARGATATHAYEHARGLLLSTIYSDGSAATNYTYNHLGQLTQVRDEAGARTLGYNAYGEQETDSLTANNVTHLVTETRDAYGRSSGYTYAKNGTLQHTVTIGYGENGRIATAGFLHSGIERQYRYSYLEGSHLLQSLSMPNGMTLTQTYDSQRDLLASMTYHRGSTLVTQRTYSYDALGRPTSRCTARQGTTTNDTFSYNPRSELASATVNSAAYRYAYDPIGNRTEAQEEETTAYTANALNQYTDIQPDSGDPFTPDYDADGNQTWVRTATGNWRVTYNSANRPTSFTREEEGGATEITCTYDSMGRRATKKVTVNGQVTQHQRYIYRGYLQIAACDLTRSGEALLWHITWDPTQEQATRPLAIRKDGTWYCYGWDLTKNISEVYKTNGGIGTAYSYAPYGSVTARGSITQPLQWSSEYMDTELGLVYYNYRHYNPSIGRWLGRDPLGEIENMNLYKAFDNGPVFVNDFKGMRSSQNQPPIQPPPPTSDDDPVCDCCKQYLEENQSKYASVLESLSEKGCSVVLICLKDFDQIAARVGPGRNSVIRFKCDDMKIARSKSAFVHELQHAIDAFNGESADWNCFVNG